MGLWTKRVYGPPNFGHTFKYLQHQFSPQLDMPRQPNESQLILALQAIKRDPKLTVRAAARIYNVAHQTLLRRKQGMPSQRDTDPKRQLLTLLEEQALVQYILDQDSQGFPLRLVDVRDMANHLRRERDASPVGDTWPRRFIQRHPELSTRLTRRYDYQRALNEDPTIIDAWFALFRNVVAKYGINDADIFNFDETGFMMGLITATMVITSSDRSGKRKSVQPGNRELITAIQAVNALGWAVPPFVILPGQNHLATWYKDNPFPRDWVVSVTSNGWTNNERGMDWIRHFNLHTRGRTVGAFRLLILDGHESHHSVEFDLFCKENKIITLCMPSHASHILQPLDVGCFGPLKKAYGAQIANLVRSRVTHISKEDFFPAFFAAHNAAMTESNIKGGFRGAGLVPLDPEHVLSKLDVRLRTPSLPPSPPNTAGQWVSQTPNNPTEATSQAAYIKNRISRHQSSSPTGIYTAIDHFAKGMSKMSHEMVFLRAEVKELREANDRLSKRRKTKKTRLQDGGALTIGDATDRIEQRELGEQIQQEMRANGSRRPRAETRARRCGICHNTGHNARTCQLVEEASEEEGPE